MEAHPKVKPEGAFSGEVMSLRSGDAASDRQASPPLRPARLFGPRRRFDEPLYLFDVGPPERQTIAPHAGYTAVTVGPSPGE